MSKPLRVAFVDHQLENFHANIFLKHIRETLKDRNAVVTGCMANDETAGRAWAAKNNAPYFSNPAELNSAADVFMILAPANPEVHLDLCKKIFPFSKPTYVDKTFAPNFAIAKEIFSLADKYKTPIQTTSALRYTQAQGMADKPNLRKVITWGGGTSFAEYAIHPIEMAVSLLGPGAESMMRLDDGDLTQLIVLFTGGRTALINVFANSETPFAASLTTAKETKYVPVDDSKLFSDTAAGILDFLASGKPNIDRAESLAIRKILDVAEDPAARKGFVKL